jgi:putative aldouronate transport system permease protein
MATNTPDTRPPKTPRTTRTSSMNRILNDSPAYKTFRVFNMILMALMAFVCIAPMINILAMSFSSERAIAAGRVFLWPQDLTLVAYEHILNTAAFWRAMLVSVYRIILGGSVNMALVILTAYPLSRTKQEFPGRSRYVAYILITMLFGGGLIPTFLVVRFTGVLDTIWALILPQAVPVYNVILLLNFFRQLPKPLEEAAFIDGASHGTMLWRIILPLSKPALATIGLFIMVYHWNEWFMAIVFLRSSRLYPLQSYLRGILIDMSFEVTSLEDVERLAQLSNRTISSAQIFVAMVPILMVYPFLQKYFAKGIVLGSVKG